MKLIIGLGNPGSNYVGTRHNIGFDVVNYLAAAPNVGTWKNKFQAQVAEVVENNEQLLFMKPETFMNLSGRAVKQAVDFYKIAVTDLLVICDDLALPLGKLRMRATGSHGGQNGLRNIQEFLGTLDYPRLRLGIGSPNEHQTAADYVLGRFKPSERAAVDDVIAKAAQAVLVWASRGLDAAMNQTNGGEQRPNQKPKPKPERQDKKPTDGAQQQQATGSTSDQIVRDSDNLK